MNPSKLLKSALVGVTATSGIASSVAPMFANEVQDPVESVKETKRTLSKQETLEKNISDSQNKVASAKTNADSAKETANTAKKNAETAQGQLDTAQAESNAAVEAINAKIDAELQPIVDEIAKLETEINQTNKELEAQKATSEKASEDLKTAQSDLKVKQKELADLKTRLESFGVKDYSELESEVNKATETLNEASASAESAKQILAEKEAELETAKAGVETAQSGLQMATEALERANAYVAGAEGEVTAAQNNLSNFTDEDAYNKNQARLEQAKVNLESAKNNVIAKTSDLETAKANLATAESVQSEKQTEYDASVTALNEANAKVTEAETAKAEAQKTLDEAVKTAGAKEDEINDLKNQIADAEKDVADAQNAYDQAKADYDSTLTPLELAQKNLADFEKAHADQLARLNQGIQGYYDSIGATAATDIIKNPRGKLNGHTNIGAANDATSLDNVINSISYLKEFNKIRVSEGLPELKVSMVLMAIAQANANWQRDTAEIGNVAHSGVYNTGENAAWGYGDAESKASPFTAWYTLEKSWHENGITDFHKIGHYKNIVNARYDYTGYAHIEEGAYGSTDIQEFDQYWGDNVYGNEATGSENDRVVTLEEFETSLNNYASRLKDVSNQRKSLEEAVKKAQTSGTEKDDTALKSTLALLNGRKDALKALNEKMAKATGEKAQADTAKAEAEANFQKAEQTVKEAEANAEAKATAKTKAEMNLSKAKAEVSAKKMAKAEAENNLAQANQDVAHISETIEALTHTIDNWNTEKAKAEKALETAQAHLKDAKANAEAKKQGLKTAKSDLAKAENKKADAQTEAEHAKADLDKANKALEEATTVFNKASEKANFYKDISDKTNATDKDVEKITGRISQLRKAKDTADAEITTLNQTVSTKKTKANLLNSQSESFKRQRAVLANVVAVGTRADLSEITDADMLALFEDLGQKVDILSAAKKTLETTKLDYQTKQSFYLKAHDDLNKAVDEYNSAMSALNTYLREQEAEAKAKQEAEKKAKNTATAKAESKMSKVNTGVESFTTGYMASAGLALAGLAATKRRRKKF